MDNGQAFNGIQDEDLLDAKSLFSLVLLVEDEVPHANLIRRALAPHVGEIRHEQTAAAALEAVQTELVELVLADLHLPDLDGFEMLRAIHQARPELPVVVMTSSSRLEDAVTAMREGASDYMVKQFDEMFVERVGLLIERTASRRRQQIREGRAIAERNAFWAATAAAQDGVAILGSDGKIAFANEAFAKFLGSLGAHGGNGADLIDHISKHDAAVAAALRAQLQSSQSDSLSSTELKIAMPAENGGPPALHFEITLSSFGRGFSEHPGFESASGPQFRRNVIWVRDITQRKEQEKFNRDLLATTSHDLKGPLGAILNSAELISEHSLNPVQSREMVTRIASCARNCITIIDELLSARRIQDGVFVINPHWYKVDEILEDIVLDYLPTAKAKSIRYYTKPVESDARIYADKLALNRLLGNLVSNAVKFTPNGGTVELWARRTDRSVQIGVSDTGPGIESQARHLLFKRYARLEKHRGVEGTGLGLFIAKNIVEAHGGQLEIKSAVGEGTTFIVTLPDAPEALSESGPASR